ncbi:DUF805 domain-containing protein [Anaerovibrio sp.]|uniref:DUF805 domain-containing protein n=1 Tax=Anaerovibrio sp. TaxID=1872532 RepID=UPI00262B418B|nr:DUF805 domain-containing protein [Anaerovibrio sp.]MDD6598625.1 DUF805 domain-containing protein [Anaerovibrio sp.]MDD7678749.1 DUF805 domain-containing protein [Anaerovibrio sp.]MDY2603963.1 DUF805 domain-containing protein [Anaerovibrio sp.]MDY4884108.1 DUF805 domain-containing protein [Anaerovibrio sp.]
MLEKMIGGRLNRKKYIMYYLATVVTCVFLMFAVSAIMLATGQASEIEQGGNVYLSGLVIGLLANLVTICLGIRRLHDLGKGGKWVLVVIIPAVFSFAVYFVENQLLTNFASALDIAVIMALAVMKGNDGANEFGPAN